MCNFAAMFLKSSVKIKEGTSYLHYRICESYRDGIQIRNRTLLSLGDLGKELSREQMLLFVKRLNDIYYEGKDYVLPVFEDIKVEELAHHYAKEITLLEAGRKAELKAKGVEEVYIDSIKNEHVRELGAEWLCYQAACQLQLPQYFDSAGWSEESKSLALTQIISRAIYPVSEFKTVSYLKENSALCEITGLDISKLTKDLLYKTSHELYRHKEGLEKFLSKRTNDLFSLDDNIILYDLTNSYFEGRMAESAIAKFGRSKEKRSDSKIVVLAAVVNPEGFLKDSQVFEGNIADSATLKNILTRLKAKKISQNNASKQIVVMDAGIATKENLQMLKNEGFDYICVSRKKLKEYSLEDAAPIVVKDKKGHRIEVRKIVSEDDDDNYYEVRSNTKALKENSMETRFTQAYEQGIRQINDALKKKGGVKKLEKVWERIGRLKQKYPSVNRLYDIEVEDDGKGKAIQVCCCRKTETASTHGTYFLRTSLPDKEERTIWQIYNTIREIESTFRCLKTDLNIRPVFHKTDDAVMAHLHLALLAYWLASTIRYQLKQKDIKSDWGEICRMMSRQKMITTSVKNTDGKIISIRKCSEPEEKSQQIYDALGYAQKPFIRRKSVVPQQIRKNFQSTTNENFMSG